MEIKEKNLKVYLRRTRKLLETKLYRRNIKWLIFSCYLLSLYPAVHSLRMWLSGIITITNSKGYSVSIWNMLEMSCFVCIVWSCLGIFLVFLLSPILFYLFLRVILFVQDVLFFVSTEYIFMFRVSIFACCRSFLTYDSNLISHPGFDFLSVIFRGTPIFSQTNFAPA